MKRWKTILIFAVILALLVGVWGIATYVKNKKDAEAQANITPTPAVEPFLNYDGADVAKIKVVNDTGTLEFTSEEVSTDSSTTEILWRLVSPENPCYSESTIKAKVSYFLLMQNISEITDLSGGLEPFGLDDPIASVELFLKSGDTVKVLFGKAAPRDSAQYCMLEGSDKVYVTSNVNADTACLGAISYMDLSVLNGIADKDATSLHFKRAKDGLDMSAISNKDGSGTGDSAVKATWRITSPVTLNADATGFYAVLGDLLSISAQTYVELNPKDLAQYGLDNPSYEFTVKTDDQEITCLLGGSAGGNLLYAYSTYTNAVFTATLQVLENIDKPFLEIADNFVNITNIWDIDTLTIDIDDTVINCKIKDSKDKTTDSDFKVNGQDANVVNSKDSSYFRVFYQSVISIYIENIEPDAKPVYNPDITMDFKMTVTSKNTLVGFVRRDASTYYVFKNGVYQGYYVNASSFYSETKGEEGVLPAYRILKNAMDKQVNGVYE